MNEFSLIKKYFHNLTVNRKDVVLGIGDDCALLQPPDYQLIAVTTDTLVEGVHFSSTVAPYELGYKALAVNLSDLAAMGATPAWLSLALTLPKINEPWLAQFCQGFAKLASQYNLQLIGGDTTQGPLSITVNAQGFVPKDKVLRRNAAKPGDAIYVTGTLGDAGAGLAMQQQKITVPRHWQQALLNRLNQPSPRIAEGQLLRDIAHAAVDISDGLAADLGHILEASGVGARVWVDKLPLSPALKNAVPYELALQFALSAGDDYELCFTVAPDKQALLASLPLHCTCIGEVIETKGLSLHLASGNPYDLARNFGYQHFG